MLRKPGKAPAFSLWLVCALPTKRKIRSTISLNVQIFLYIARTKTLWAMNIMRGPLLWIVLLVGRLVQKGPYWQWTLPYSTLLSCLWFSKYFFFHFKCFKAAFNNKMNGNLEFSFESKEQELTRIKIAINIKPRRRTWVFSLIFLQPFENRLSVHNNRSLLYFLLFILTKGEKFPNVFIAERRRWEIVL